MARKRVLCLEDNVSNMRLVGRIVEAEKHDFLSAADGSSALGLIRQVGFSGSYMVEEHTAHHFRGEHYMPKLMVREPYETWEQEGCRSVVDRARERVREILAQRSPRTLDPAIEQELAAYRQQVAERSLEDFYAGEDEANQDWSSL